VRSREKREKERAVAASQSTTAIRSYRIYFRDGGNAIAKAHDIDLASDDEVRQLAELMLIEQPAYHCAEIWDRARLVCVARKGE
jgi:hypothetical protein